MAQKGSNDCYYKAAFDEEIFTVRAQDKSSPEVVCEWIKKNIETAPKVKLREALECAIKMREHLPRKVAD